MSAAVSAPGPSQDVRPVRRALVSVYDKTGLDGLVRGLHEAGVALVSTGGSAALIESLGLPVTKVEDLTGFPECLEGRVKTLHPRVHAGILADTRKPDHVAQLADLGVEAFELVVVNLYPFAATVASGASPDECVEQIDIGGPSMVRAAAKNHPSVAVVTDPATYDAVLDAVRGGGFTPRAAQAPGGAGLRAHRHLRRARRVVDGQRLHRQLRRHRLPGLGRRDLGARRRCCATARTRTSTRPSTPTASSRSRRWPRRPSCTARRCRTTTTSTRMPPCAPRTTTATSRPWPSSSTPTPAASPSAPTSPTPTARPTSATRCRPSAASSPPTAR